MTETETQLTIENETLRNDKLRLQAKLDSVLAMVRKLEGDTQSVHCKAWGIINFLQDTEGRAS